MTDDEDTRWTAAQHSSSFLDLIGPVAWWRDEGTGLLAARLRVDGRHLNSRGRLHGGVLSTLVDVVLGHAAAETTDPKTALTTASLNVDYLSGARPGQWLTASASAAHVGTALAFARGEVTADGAPVAQASAVFRVHPQPSGGPSQALVRRPTPPPA